MPRYPTQQAQMLALSKDMIAGYTDKPALFPNADVALLQSLQDAYYAASAAQTEAATVAQLATEAKQEAMAGLRADMKRQLKQSQVDTVSNPENLNYIGWGRRHDGHSIEAPGQPMRLRSVDEGESTLLIEWKRPARGSGGPVTTYFIESRQLTKDEGSGGESGWRHEAASLETTITLKNQPRGVQLEYRVKAINKAGQSNPSNTIAVVL